MLGSVLEVTKIGGKKEKKRKVDLKVEVNGNEFENILKYTLFSSNMWNKSTFLIFLSIVFMSSLLRHKCFHASHYVYVSCLIAKLD